ncbi:putative protein RarD [Streptomyces afghaniensis 772]|uniref:Uncharacterized protein n=1 Tax=Streptomyces afghaniensis 772 TaxID=1283301 RepID=S4M563_9ACTN|nr:putative protein RarD [Streptomyces afghaniensis 772]
MEVEDAEQELEDRRQVLQQADRGQGHADGGGAEADQGQRGDDAGRGEQRRVPRALGGEGGLAPRAQPHQEGEGGQELDHGLGGQRLHAAEVQLLLHQPVRGEGEGEAEGDPRRPAVADGQHDDRRGAGPDRQPLHRPQPLLQQQHTHRDGDQRIDEVPERGLDDVPGVHGPDVQAPVEGDERRGDRDEAQPARLPQQLTGPGPAAQHEQGGAHEDQRPHHPVGQDLQRPGGLQQGPEQRNEAPHPVGREAVQQSYVPLAPRLAAHGPLLRTCVPRSRR